MKIIRKFVIELIFISQKKPLEALNAKLKKKTLFKVLFLKNLKNLKKISPFFGGFFNVLGTALCKEQPTLEQMVKKCF